MKFFTDCWNVIVINLNFFIHYWYVWLGVIVISIILMVISDRRSDDGYSDDSSWMR